MMSFNRILAALAFAIMSTFAFSASAAVAPAETPFFQTAPGGTTSSPLTQSPMIAHGCHKRSCLPGCPRCRRAVPGNPSGHCKQGGRVYICRFTAFQQNDFVPAIIADRLRIYG